MHDNLPVADGEVRKKDKDEEPDEAEKALVTRWTNIIESLESDHKEHFEVIDSNRKRVWGDLHKEDDAGTVRVNVAHSHIKKSVNRTYARNPEFSIRPTRFINPSEIPMWRMFGQTAELILNRAFQAAQFKRRAKTCLRAAKTSRIGWLKTRWQQETAIDGEVRNRIRDGNDELARLNKLRTDAQDIEQEAKKKARMKELKEMMELLATKEEVITLQGLIFDVVSPKNMLIPSKALESFDEYINVPYMIEKIWKDKDEVKEKYGDLPAGTKYYKKRIDTTPSDATNSRDVEEDGDLILLYEIWDIESQRVKILAHGSNEFLANFIPKKLGARWYPYFALAQNPVDGQFEPLSDTELVKELAEEINNSMTKLRDHRDICVPHWVADAELVNEKDMKTYVHATLGEIILVQGQPGKRMSEIIEPANHPTIDPAVYQTQHLEQAIEKVAGGGEITNPKSNRSRTLGEANKLAQDVGTDISADTDEIEDWFEDIVRYVLEILLQRLSEEHVVAIAGPLAEPEMGPPNEQFPEGQPTGKLKEGVVWPKQSANDIFNNVNLVIKSGSSGKPGVQEEVQVWTQFLMPRITELLVQVSEMRAGGKNVEADSLLFIGQETLRRVDPYFDINEFVPPPQPPTEEEQKASAMQEKEASNNLQLQQAQIEKNQAETARVLADKNLKEFELEKMKSEIEFTSEQIESLDLDDSIKGIMSRLDARLKEVEVEVKHREMGQRDRELDIKEMEATNKATQLAKQTNGRSNGK